MIMTSSLRASMVALSTGLLLVSAGCGSQVVSGPGDALSTGSGGSTATVTASTGGGGDSGTGGSAVCVPQPEEPGPFVKATCADLAALAVSHAVVTDANGDGQVDAGESAVLQVNLDEIAGVGTYFYPGVLFETASAGVTVSSNAWLYGIMGCQTVPMSGEITIGSDVAPGTVVTITARVAFLNHTCPDAFAITVPITVH